MTDQESVLSGEWNWTSIQSLNDLTLLDLENNEVFMYETQSIRNNSMQTFVHIVLG